MATVVRNLKCECYHAGGVADHVHLAIRLSRTMNLAELVETLKTSSSKWLKTQSSELTRFAWQLGYGAFSVGPAQVDDLVGYINRQEAHHEKVSFQDELRAFLRKYGMEPDEQYLDD